MPARAPGRGPRRRRRPRRRRTPRSAPAGRPAPRAGRGRRRPSGFSSRLPSVLSFSASSCWFPTRRAIFLSRAHGSVSRRAAFVSSCERGRTGAAGKGRAWASASHRWNGWPGPARTCGWARRWCCATTTARRWCWRRRRRRAERLADLRARGPVDLAMTGWRAETLKARAYDGDLARVVLPADADLAWVRATADPSTDLAWPMKGPYVTRRGGGAALHRAAIALCKQAHLLPAALVVPLAIAAAASLAAADRLTRGRHLRRAGGRGAAGDGGDRRGAGAARGVGGGAGEGFPAAGRRGGALCGHDRGAGPGAAGAVPAAFGLLHRRPPGQPEVRLRAAAAGGAGADRGRGGGGAALSQPGGAGDRARQQDAGLRVAGPGVRHGGGEPPAGVRGRRAGFPHRRQHPDRRWDFRRSG